MQPQSVFAFLTCALTVTALPLNINLGAFSPAFVVGDGEISLDGENAGALMETLETGASQSAEAQGVSTEGNVADVDTAVNAAIANAQAEAAAEETEKANNENKGGIGKNPNVKRGKVPLDAPSSKKRSNKNQKRGLAGFRTALNFANKAQNNAPEVELGTGDEGSGVGIIVNPGKNVPADSAAAGAKAKRSVDTAEDESRPAKEKKEAEPEKEEKLGITVMAIAEM